MSLAITHFAVGVTIVMILSIVWNRDTHPSLILGGGLWAMFPDAHHILATPTLAEAVAHLHGTVWANLFFFHRLLDVADPQDSIHVASAALAAMCLVSLYQYMTDVQRQAQRRQPRRVQR